VDVSSAGAPPLPDLSLTTAAHDDAVAAALSTAHGLGLYVIVGLHALTETRLRV
jgi:hypothetical protein